MFVELVFDVCELRNRLFVWDMPVKATTWMRAAALGAALVGLLRSACSEDKAATSAPSLGRRGESCTSTIDCAPGLACVNEVCTVGDFVYQPTGKECVRIECRTPEDCCPEPPSYCVQLQQECAQGLTVSCSSWQTYCTCDPTVWACDENQCVEVCANRGALCNIRGICDGSRCVQCLMNTDCFSSNEVCTGNECVSQCEEQADCPYFHDCQNGACVEVGCSNDRECIAFTRNVLAYCDPEKECQIPCATDIECDSATSFDFTACINGLCQSVGCDSDEECRILLRVGSLGNDFEAECRVKPPEGQAAP